ncbi:hypothetical protein BDV36DRAFT_305395 [Aspergillus pseudocaelatus]|uniref:Uncharacterized protein n=1 Tax=Aspergillus pseudocaelatus TaxID=1825620 RepID=A0ABQ6WVV9_9EURO|nr:hypothetical protein BDV36DRAFT_305395 [Aspergillus pseudocaelatus]
MVPDYEVSFLLKPSVVLSSDNELTGTVLSTFDVTPIATKLNVQFLDKSSRDIYNAGWSAHIRKAENEKNFELTYKKRYAIRGGDIDAALVMANNDGFNDGSAKYKAQVEWGYLKQTLSVSRQKKVAGSGDSGLDLPGTNDSRNMLINEAPARFDNSISDKWGTRALAESRIFGPILVKRFIGSWKKIPLYLEIWPFWNLEGTGIDYIVEASFETDDRDIASVERTNLTAYLESKEYSKYSLLRVLIYSQQETYLDYSRFRTVN